MKFILLSIGFLAAAAFLFSCKTKKKITSTDMGTPFISLSKSSCFGKCKEYDFDIYANKTAIYTGKKNVNNIGVFTSNITDEEYAGLVGVFQNNNFEKMDTSYLSGAKDLQHINIAYNGHAVMFHKNKAPKELLDILEKMDEMAANLKWK